MIIKRLKKNKDLIEFCETCKTKGFKNNESLKAMKFDFAEFWGAWCNNKLVAVAGAHALPEVHSNAVRVLFRGCQIKETYKGLGKHHMNSIGFRDILPVQMDAYKDKDLYITTNVYNDASGRMNRTHRAMKLLDKEGILEYNYDMELYFTKQSIWKINKERYNEIRYRLETSK